MTRTNRPPDFPGRFNDVRFACADGVTLSGTVYSPATELRAAVLIAPATGIRRRFYRAFAEHLASCGYGVLTYENRGIGDSKRGPLRGFQADLVDWGRLDQSAALSTLQEHFPRVKTHLVGHSAGGQLVGLMPNAQELSSMFNVACSSGRLRNMRGVFRVQAELFMNVFIPTSNALLGYTHSPLIGMGEPLPAGVARDWARWCKGSGYVATELGTERIPDSGHLYSALTFPSTWLFAADDVIANEENVREMAAVYPKMPATIVKLDPHAEGLRDIGHMKFFKVEQLWSRATEWLAAHP